MKSLCPPIVIFRHTTPNLAVYFLISVLLYFNLYFGEITYSFVCAYVCFIYLGIFRLSLAVMNVTHTNNNSLRFSNDAHVNKKIDSTYTHTHTIHANIHIFLQQNALPLLYALTVMRND